MADLSVIRDGLDNKRTAQLVMCHALGPLIEDPLDTAALQRVCAVQDMLVHADPPVISSRAGQ